MVQAGLLVASVVDILGISRLDKFEEMNSSEDRLGMRLGQGVITGQSNRVANLFQHLANLFVMSLLVVADEGNRCDAINLAKEWMIEG